MSGKLKYSKLKVFGLSPRIPPPRVPCPLCGGLLEDKPISHAVMDGNELWICKKHPKTHTFWISSWNISVLHWYKCDHNRWYDEKWVTTGRFKKRWKMFLDNSGKLIFEEIKRN